MTLKLQDNGAQDKKDHIPSPAYKQFFSCWNFRRLKLTANPSSSSNRTNSLSSPPDTKTMVISEITEEKDDDDEAEDEEQETPSLPIDAETQKRRIRQIIEYQKSLFWSSSSSLSTSSSAAAASAAASRSSLSSSRRSCSLMELMKSGSTSLRRLFDMEHTSLADYLDEYSATPVVKTVPLWGSSDSDADRFPDPWDSFKATRHYGSARRNESGSCGHSEFASQGTSFVVEGQKANAARRVVSIDRKLERKRSFRRLPGFGTWRRRGFRFRLRLRRLRIMICGRKF